MSSVGIWVKICGITRPGDARIVERAGANALGLLFAPTSSRYVTLEQAADVCDSVSSRIQKVGVFVRPEWDWIAEVLERLPLDILQWHGGPLSVDEYAKISGFGLPWIHAVRWGGEAPLENPEGAGMILVEGRSEKGPGGTGDPWKYKDLTSVTWPLPLILSGGLTPGSVEQAIRSLRPAIPFGVDVSSGVESAPGRKDERKIYDFVEKVRSCEEHT